MAHATTGLSRRTPQQVLTHHGEAMKAEDVDAVVQDFAETACLVTSDTVIRGNEGIRDFFARFFQAFPRTQWTQWSSKATFADNIVLLEWTADSARGTVPDGVDTVVFQEGLIQCQTIHFTVLPKP
jgi:ketosteroid isomerase-like protein